MRAKKKATPAAKRDPNHLLIENDPGKTRERKLAETALSPPILNAITAMNFVKPLMGENDITEAVKVVAEKVNKVKANDLSGLEATLTAQVVTLDVMFNELARRAGLNFGEYLNAAEKYMRLALKAQAQTARTVEVIAALKNPPVVFAKQANISHGHQQINNHHSATSTHAHAHAEKNINQQNELLTEDSDAQMDTRGTSTAILADPPMEALVKSNRA